LLSLLVFAQGALAAARCDWQERSAARAVAEQQSMPCHEAGTEARNVNLCLAHCEADSQTLDKSSVHVQALPQTAVLTMRPAIRPAANALRLAFAPPGAPPPLILFQVFRQ
jgi:hypothetical protein